jgi:photosystem II stability/assembly factor-like uncharacterized protein
LGAGGWGLAQVSRKSRRGVQSNVTHRSGRSPLLLVILIALLTAAGCRPRGSWCVVRHLSGSDSLPVIHLTFSSDRDLWLSSGALLEHSSDNGITWRTVRKMEAPHYESYGGVLFVDQQTGWLYGSSSPAPDQRRAALWKTVDSGQTWKPIEVSENIEQLVELVRCPGGDLFGSSARHILASVDGERWRIVYSRDASDDLGIALACTVHDVVLGRTSMGQVVRSRDRGVSWESVDLPRENLRLGSITALDSVTWITADKGVLFSSHNDGDSWVRIQTPAVADLWRIARHGNELRVAGVGAVLASRDGRSWTNEVPGDDEWYTVAVSPHGQWMVGGSSYSVIASPWTAGCLVPRPFG